MKDLQLIAKGRISDVYLINKDEVIKLYHDNYPTKNINIELENAQLLHQAGLPVPKVKGIQTINGRTGLVFEFISGDSLLGILKRKPWRFYGIFFFLGKLHRRIHEYSVPTLHSQSEVLALRINNASEVSQVSRYKALEHLDELKNDVVVCHGDFQPGNVLISKDGQMIVDWLHATQGNPLCDVARSILSISVGAPPQNATKVALLIRNIGRALLHPENIYLKAYTGNSQHSTELDKWIYINAVARLGEAKANKEDLSEETNKLLQIIDKK